MGTLKTTEQFKREVYELVGNEYEVLTEYVHAHHKLQVQHNKCGYEYWVTPGKFLQGRRCPRCNHGYTLSTKEFTDIVHGLVGDDYIVLGDYRGTDYKIEMIHRLCGYKWNVVPKHFLAGSRCPACAGNIKRSHRQFANEVYLLVGNEYRVIGEYESTDTPILLEHDACGLTFPVAPKHFLRGTRCPDCAKNIVHDSQRKTTEQFKKEVFDRVGDEFKILGEYKGAHKPISIMHQQCGKVFEMSAARDFLISSKCRVCSEKESNGEKIVRHYIEKQGWKYKKEYRFNDCRYIYPLPFDFAVFSNDDQLQLLVEYDGQGHYQPVEIFGGENALRERLQNDKIKTEYCNQNRIPLLRIPFFKLGELEEEFWKFLKKYQLSSLLING